MVREKKILQGQVEDWQFYFELGKIDILKKRQEGSRRRRLEEIFGVGAISAMFSIK